MVADLGWTRQELTLPVIARILKPGGQALSLVKPQYEVPGNKGVLPEEQIPEALEMVHSIIPDEFEVLGEERSPYVGSGGNVEYWLWLRKHE